MYGIFLLMFWFLMYALAGDWVYRMHSSLFMISRPDFELMHYAGMMFFKLFIFAVFLIPYIALRVTTK